AAALEGEDTSDPGQGAVVGAGVGGDVEGVAGAVAVDLGGAAGQRVLDVEGVGGRVRAAQQDAVVGRVVREVGCGRVVNDGGGEAAEAAAGHRDVSVGVGRAVVADDQPVGAAAALEGQGAPDAGQGAVVGARIRGDVEGVAGAAVDLGGAAGQRALHV